MRKETEAIGVRPATSYLEIVGVVLKQLRTEKGLDQAALASAVGIAQSTWSRVENGAVPITVEQLALVCGMLGVPPGSVLEKADRAAHQMRQRGVEVVPRRAASTGMEDGLAFLKGAAILALLVAVLGGK